MCKVNKSFIFYILMVCSVNTFAQRPSEKSIASVAKQSMASKNYYDALVKYQELLEFDSTNINYLYNAAEAARLRGAYSIASRYYESLLKQTDNSTYPQASFWLANVKQLMGDYSAAKEGYLLYKSTHGGDDVDYSAYADKEINACDWAIKQIANPNKEIKITRLSDNINSDYSDFAATGSDDNIFFSSNRFDNIYNKLLPKRTISRFVSSKNNSASVISDRIKLTMPALNYSNACFSSDHSTVVFTICEDINESDKRCDLYSAHVDEEGIWSDLTKLPDFINLKENTSTQPCLAVDKDTKIQTLYFVSDRPGGKGKLDIWYTSIDKYGSYSEPLNLSALNTPYDDVTPNYDNEKATLYFSSKGYLGLGGFDVYSSQKTFTGWSTVINLGAPINSSYDELYFYKGKNSKALLSSNRTESKLIDNINNACCLDIYSVIMPECDVTLNAFVYDAITKEEIKGAKIILTELGEGSMKPITMTNENGNDFKVPLNCNKEYKLEVSKPGYKIPESITFSSGRPGEFKVIRKNINLMKEELMLDVLSFENPSGSELVGVTIEVIDLDVPGSNSMKLSNPTSNVNQFVDLIPCHKLKIIASKPGYETVTNELKIECNSFGKIIHKIYLNKVIVEKCTCGDGKNSLFNLNTKKSPRVLHRLGSNPEFGSLRNLSAEQMLAKLKKAASSKNGDQVFLNSVAKSIGLKNFNEITIDMISEVELPRGVVGNIGYSKFHKTLYVKLENDPIDLKAFKITGPNGCSLHFMKTCGNHFFYCPSKSMGVIQFKENSTVSFQNMKNGSHSNDIAFFQDHSRKMHKAEVVLIQE